MPSADWVKVYVANSLVANGIGVVVEKGARHLTDSEVFVSDRPYKILH